jgi:hypothetical protein
MPTHPRNRVSKRLFAMLAEGHNDYDLLLQLVRQFAMEELEGNAWKVYDYIDAMTSEYWRTQQAALIGLMGSKHTFHPPRFTSTEIATTLGLSGGKYASMLLKDLHEMGLLGRAQLEGGTGNEWEYWRA